MIKDRLAASTKVTVQRATSKALSATICRPNPIFATLQATLLVQHYPLAAVPFLTVQGEVKERCQLHFETIGLAL